jgi:hypothetical protein
MSAHFVDFEPTAGSNLVQKIKDVRNCVHPARVPILLLMEIGHSNRWLVRHSPQLSDYFWAHEILVYLFAVVDVDSRIETGHAAATQ